MAIGKVPIRGRKFIFKRALMDSSPVVFMNLSEVDLIDFRLSVWLKSCFFIKWQRLRKIHPPSGVSEKEMLSC